MKLTKLFTALAVTLCAASSHAGVVSVGTAASDASAACAGCISNDILINFDGNLRGQQLYIKLNSGSIYNTPAASGGSNIAPNSAFFAVFPELEFDTYVTVGGLTSADSESVLEVGGAVDIPGAPTAGTLGEPDPSVFSFAWAPGTGVDVPNGASYPVARITLSGDANGDAWIFSSVSGGDAPLLTRRSIIDGGRIVPEPASMALAGLALVGLVASRRHF